MAVSPALIALGYLVPLNTLKTASYVRDSQALGAEIGHHIKSHPQNRRMIIVL